MEQRQAFALAIHGGAGNIDFTQLDAAEERHALEHIRELLNVGRGQLLDGVAALQVVEDMVRGLESFESFNAGRGAVLTAAGHAELDAAIMDGRTREAGAVAAVQRIKHPITAARVVMRRSPHVLLVGAAAEAFCEQHGVALTEPDYFITERRQDDLERWHQTQFAQDPGNTVGAVALDRNGNLAAATSTGGLTGKLPGRVGDSPLIGCGTWADDKSCAISATGSGEHIIRCAFAHDIDARMRLQNAALDVACREALLRLAEIGGFGGCIAVDAMGNIVMDANTSAMYCGAVTATGKLEVRHSMREGDKKEAIAQEQ